MSEHKDVLMNATIFTDIVDSIASAGGACGLDEKSITEADKTIGTDTMKKLSGLLEEVYDNSIVHKEHVSFSLPYALGTLRDSVIRQDEMASNAIEIKSESR